MFGTTAMIKAVAMLLVAVLIAAAGYYVTNIKADLAVSQANNDRLIAATAQQTALIASMQQDIEQIQRTNNELQDKVDKHRRDVEVLNTKFSKRDFGALAAEKPELIARLVNRGTKNVMRCFELASGAPLNDTEKNAKTPMEANRECPGIIDNDYLAPAR